MNPHYEVMHNILELEKHIINIYIYDVVPLHHHTAMEVDNLWTDMRAYQLSVVGFPPSWNCPRCEVTHMRYNNLQPLCPYLVLIFMQGRGKFIARCN